MNQVVNRSVPFDAATIRADRSQWIHQIRVWARELGFSHIGVAGVDLSSAEPHLLEWLARGYHGNLHYMEKHGLKRARPAELVPGTLSVITARMPYLPHDTAPGWQGRELARLDQAMQGVVSLYARGRDYHKVVRARLRKLCERIETLVGPFGYRAFSDSAPVLEKELAQRSGQGWRGKHSMILSRDAGSMFFLGEIYVDFALEATRPVTAHCGTCTACMDVCPTAAIVAPGVVDARRCISYLTIENHGPIPEDLRPLMGNRVFGCDDCQTICPWNKYAQTTEIPDFDERSPLVGQSLIALFAWDEATFLKNTEGGPIRRINHERWLRNVAVALGNALREANIEQAREIRAALRARAKHESALVREHVAWALAQREQV